MWCRTRAWSQSGPGEKGNAMFRLLSEVIENFTYRETKLQTRFQKSWDTVQIVNKKGMQ